MRFFIWTIITFLGISASSFAQLTTVVQDPVSLVQNVLLGDPNITVSNITFQGAQRALGRFDATGTNLGITSGIVMTTGNITGNSDGPKGPNNSASAGEDNGSGGYQVLTNIVGNNTYNATVLSFDFSTCSDSIEFKYVFGSEEYPEYVGSQFNDVFGFFISGPGFSGQQNIARLPNGSVVAINNVNAGNNTPAQGVPITGPSNPQYFVNNGNGAQAPYNSSNIYIQYDGFTKVLTARAKIQCSETYRLTLAIADVGDAFWDSGIFLEAKSFKASDPVRVSYSLSENYFNAPNVLAEPCTQAKVRVDRTNCNINSPLTLNLTKSGTATNGVDYQNLPATVTIPAGQLFTEFNVIPIYDLNAEGTENVHLKFNYTDNCGDAREKELELFIRDVDPVTVELNASELVCPGDNAVITSTVTGGQQPYSYTWNTGATTPSIEVDPASTTTYTLTVKDNCIKQGISASVVVSVPPFVPLDITASNDIVEICPYLPKELTSHATGGFGGYTYQWSTNFGNQLGNDSSQLVTPSQTTTYTVVVTDKCGLKDSTDVLYTITSPPLVVTLSPMVEICPGDSVQLTSSVTGGYGQYYYHWPHSGETTPSVWVNPIVSTSYMLVVSDECQTFSVSQVTRVNVVKPTANFEPSSSVLFNNLDITFANLSSNATSYQWNFGDGNTSTDVNPNNNFADPGTYIVTLIATDDKGCVDTIRKPIVINEEYYLYIPNTFTPDGDEFNSDFIVTNINIIDFKIDIFNRWGQKIFTANDVAFKWDGTYKGVLVPDGTYSYKVAYIAKNGTEGKFIGHINVLR